MQSAGREYIQSLISPGESETLEFKRTIAERREVAKSVCAMANQRGGRVVIGVNPDGQIVGQQVGDRTIEHLSQELGAIDPPVLPSIDRIDLGNGLEALAVKVDAGYSKPYSYRNVAYLRAGNTNRVLSRSEYDRLIIEHAHGERRWENEPAAGWTIDRIDSGELVRTVREAIRRGRLENPATEELSELLRGLGLLRDGQLLRAGAVLFGRTECLEVDYPQCMLRVAKFRGRDRSEFLDNRQFYGNAFSLLRSAERFLIDNLPIAGRITSESFERVDTPLYPTEALREALANAFCHKDYSIGGGSVAVAIYDDRLEITSSWTLHFGLTVATLFEPHESLPWNPLIARSFHRRGIIETWGRGIAKMAELATGAGLPEPGIEEIAGCVTVRFAPSRYVPPQRIGHNLTERQRAVLKVINGAGAHGLAFGDIAPQLDLTRKPLQNELNVLRSLNLVFVQGRGRGARWYLTSMQGEEP